MDSLSVMSLFMSIGGWKEALHKAFFSSMIVKIAICKVRMNYELI